MTGINLKTILTHAVDRYPDRTALEITTNSNQYSLSYGEWNKRINRVAHALADMGVRQSDRVAFYVMTAESSVTCYFACQKIGAVAVPMNFRLTADEAAHILHDSGSRILVYSTRLYENVKQLPKLVPFLHEFIAVKAEDFPDIPEGHHDFGNLAANFPRETEPYIQPRSGDLSALVYTSGTTGNPKGVMHTHENDSAIAMNCIMEYGLRHTDIALHIAPLYHVGGMQAFFLPHLMVGGTNALLGKYDPGKALNRIQKHKISTLFAVPAQIVDMLHYPDFASFDVSSLRFITTGGSAIPAKIMAEVQKKFCPNLFNGYGMTEASLSLLLHPEDVMKKLGSCGKPTLISQLRIAGKNGRQVKPNQIGELQVSGPQVMTSYWNKPRETQEILQNGWLKTGDLFSRDEEGFYWFHGRKDDMIISGGENISPIEVENILFRMPEIRDVAVAGTSHTKWGQAVTAFVVKTKKSLNEKQIDDFCKAQDDLNNFKRPRRIVFVDSLPRNPSGKVLRHKLETLLEE